VQLRREVNRTNRSGSPLSVVVFSVDGDARERAGLLYPLSNVLVKCIRTGDIAGWYGSNALAVLLPDTHGAGAEVFVGRVLAAAWHPSVSARTTTYPDQMLGDLAQPGGDEGEAATACLSGCFTAASIRSPAKRAVDILGASLACLLLSPILLLTAIAVKTTSRGPVIFRQTRIGEGGAPFVFLKFRSMYVDADDEAHRRYVDKLIAGQVNCADTQAKDAAVFKITADPRITPAGKFIRKTSIDELPQLWNVLRGEMSLVGPRPPLPYEVEKYRPWHLRRILEAKPGMTGLWQVEGRSRTSFDDMVRLDLKYVEQWSLWLDLKIMIRTIGVVLFCKGGL
jgi:exopolysaccharide biosynthesis polyprenyl glycosylphosphotransferase